MHKFESRVAWKDEFSGNLAIFCSDERFVKATLEFLDEFLKFERCDLFVVAGSVAFIAQNESPLMERLELLIKAHKIKNVVLITHENCGYYKNKYSELSTEKIKKKQLEDLIFSASKLREMGQNVLAFSVSVKDGKIVFEEFKINRF